MKRPIVKIGYKAFLFFLPVILILIYYIVSDPFKVLYHYDNYFVFEKPSYVASNKDYFSTQMFINNYPKYQYDSFIFGSSRSMFFQVKDWQEHIASKRCFHFDAAGETLYGLSVKMKYFEQNQITIKNALIVLDKDVLTQTNNTLGHLFIKHPVLSGQNRLLFQMEFVKAFFNARFLSEYLYFRFTGKVIRNVMKGGYLDDNIFNYDPMTNEIRFEDHEKTINTNPYDYYRPRSHLFYQRDKKSKMYPPLIKDEQKKMLEEIYKILIQNQTDYRIVISPLYDQIKFNYNDYNYLCSLFGPKNVYDFSGINDITNNMYNYYDFSHYRPHVAKYLLDIMYKNG